MAGVFCRPPQWRGILLGFALAVSSGGADAQDGRKTLRIGWLQNQVSSFPPHEGFRQGLRQLGYAEGRNVTVDVRSANGDLARLPELVRELLQLNVDVLLVAGEQGLRAAKDATNVVPIVVVACDPLDSLVASIARPGGKATGFTCISSELASKRLQLLKDMVPNLSRVAVLFNPDDRNKPAEYQQMVAAADQLALTLRPYEATSPGEIVAAMDNIGNGSSQALVMLADPFMNSQTDRIAAVALERRLPAIYGFRQFPAGGGLASYGANMGDAYRYAATYVDKILKGADPGELPVEQPRTFELVINLKTAKALGLVIPPTLLTGADEVIE
jgi:putative ABC transport system substrate-binding protein